MTPFKFGKKQKSKEKDHSNGHGGSNNGNDSTFSSPSSQKHVGGQSNNSPTFSNYSNNSQFQKSFPNSGAGGGGTIGPNTTTGSGGSVPGSYQNSPIGLTPQQGFKDQGVGLIYDQNNNYHTKSPQKFNNNHAGQTPKNYQPFSPIQSNQVGQNQLPMPQYGNPLHGQGIQGQQQQQQQQQQSGPGIQGQFPPVQSSQRGGLKSPWSRSKLLISPFPRYRHAASSHANEKGEIFIMGGLHNTSVYGDTWIIKPDFESRQFQSFQVDIYDNSPAPRVGHASTLCGNAYVIFGGDTVTNEAGEIDNDLYLFNMNSHAWTIPKPIGKKPSGRYGHSIGVIAITNYDSKLYLYGGQLDDVVYNDLCVFNLSSFRRPDVHWEWISPKDNVRPPPLTNHSMDIYDNKLWIFGGSTGKKLSNDLWNFDPLLERWDKIKTLGTNQPPPMEEHASVIYKDLMIVYGGKNIDGDALNDLYFLNLITKTWFKFPTNFPLEPQGKYGHTLSILKNDKLLILGGHLPDYANLGENLEVSNIDNGVGTILNLLDLTNLPKLVPGLQQYSTPNRTNQDRFPNQQSIFTPQKTPQQQRTPSSGSSYKPNDGIPPTGVTGASNVPSAAIGAGSAAVAGAAVYGHGQQNQGDSLDSERPGFQKSHTPRQYSAEDVFQQRNLQTQGQSQPQVTPQKIDRLDVPNTQPQSFSSPEEDLPLQIPSPIRTDNEIPGSFPSSASGGGIGVNHTGNHYDDQAIPKNASDEVTKQIPGGFNDDFKTPNASPSKTSVVDDVPPRHRPFPSTSSTASHQLQSQQQKQQQQQQQQQQPKESEFYDDQHLAPGLYKNEDAKNSDFLDSYVHGDSKSDVGFDKDDELAPRQIIPDSDHDDYSAKSIGTGIVGAGAIGTAGLVGANKLKSSETGEAGEASGTRDLKTTGVTAGSSGEKDEVKQIIASLSQELKDLKLSTSSQIKEASSKVQLLEHENAQLRQQMDQAPSQDDRELDEQSYKRKHIKLNTDYQILNQNHTQLKSKLNEIEPIFSSNLLDLQKLNNIIKQQSATIDETQRALSEQEDYKLKFKDLEGKYQALEDRYRELSESRGKEFIETHGDVKQLSSGLDNFLSKYLTTDESGATNTRSLSETGGVDAGPGSGPGQEEVTSSLQSHIDDLLKENEELHTQHKSLQGKYSLLESNQQELESLKAKVAELSKMEENYKQSLHSVKNSSRALQVSQSELNKQKELTTKLQQELEELKLFRANRKSSRNTTPIVNDFSNHPTPKQPVTTDEEEEDIENAHYNLKIRDLQAELYITQQERNDLKRDVLELKKKMLQYEPSHGSF